MPQANKSFMQAIGSFCVGEFVFIQKNKVHILSRNDDSVLVRDQKGKEYYIAKDIPAIFVW